ncbi:MAG: type II toxin-antitoxin system VapC family toxin [Candidatus Sulfotelmatobacter sp.]
MSLVLDSSVTLARILSDETTAAVERVFDLVSEGGAWVPGLWRLEVANALEMGVRRGRHTAEFRDSMLADLSLLMIRIDPESDRRAWGKTLRLAERHRLPIYDTAYLEIALRRGLPLATLDQELRAAASNEKVPLIGV